MIFFAFNKNNSIFGLSEVTISKNKKIISHIDYWDSYNNFILKYQSLECYLNLF